MINGRPITLSVFEPEEPVVIAPNEVKESGYQKPNQDAASDFRIVKQLVSGAQQNVNFIHDVFIAKRSVDGQEEKENLFLKTIVEKDMTPAENKLEARVEVMGQRYARLGDLNQPCSRYVFDEENNQHLVSSVEVRGFRAFSTIPPEEIRNNILSNQFKGAGRKFFWRWALDDYDFNLSNVGVDADNNVIILDGGWYFGRRYRDYPNEITARDFQDFPWLNDYRPDFFLDHIRRVKVKATGESIHLIGEGEILCKEMITDPQFRHDFFEGVLQFIVMPDAFTTNFALMHISDSATINVCEQVVHVVENYIQPEFQRSATKVAVDALAYLKQNKTHRDILNYTASIREYQKSDAGFVRHAERIGKLGLERKKQMRTVALESRDFRRYLRSEQAAVDLENYIASLKAYEQIDKDEIFSYVPDLEQSIRDTFSALQLANEEAQILCHKLTCIADATKPNTRFIRNQEGNIESIAIAPVGGLTLFSEIEPELIRHRLLSGEYKGAGAQLFWQWAFDNYDFGLGNIGVDSDGKVVALEAGVYLGKSVRFYNNRVTLKDFEAFPLIEDFDPKYWLDHINYHLDSHTDKITKRKGEGRILSVLLTQHPQFKHEYYEAVLQFLLLPDAYFYEVSKATHFNVAEQLAKVLLFKTNPAKTEATSKERADILIARRNQMQVVALQSKKFNEYLKSARSNSDFDKFVTSISEFVAADEDKVIPSVPDLIKALKEKFIKLRIFQLNELKRYNHSNEAAAQMRDAPQPDRPIHYQALSQFKLSPIAEQDDRELELPDQARLEAYHEEEKHGVVGLRLPKPDLQIYPAVMNDPRQPIVLLEMNDVPVPKNVLEPMTSSVWRSIIKGAVGTLFVGALVATGLIAYGLLTVATLGANIIFTAALATSVGILGGLLGFAMADNKREAVEQPAALPNEDPIFAAPLVEEREEVVEAEEAKAELHAIVAPPVVPIQRAESIDDVDMLDEAVEAEEVEEECHSGAIPPFVAFYRTESTGSNISLVGDSFDDVIVAHEIATDSVVKEDHERLAKQAFLAAKFGQFKLPPVDVRSPLPPDVDPQELARRKNDEQGLRTVSLGFN
jgi:hypothetical protein